MGSKLIEDKRQNLKRRLRPTDNTGIGAGYITFSEGAALGIDRIGKSKQKPKPKTHRKSFIREIFNNR